MTSEFDPNQPREENGQWATKPMNPPGVALAETVDGSFLFPPADWPGGPQQYIEFWETTPIPDEALTNFASSYASVRDEWAEHNLAVYMTEYGNGGHGGWDDYRALRRVGKHEDAAALQKQREDAAEKYRAEMEAEYPARIPNAMVRPLARAAQMCANLTQLYEDEREVVLNHPMFPTSNGHATVKSLFEGWQIANIMPDAFYSRETAVERQLRELARRIG